MITSIQYIYPASFFYVHCRKHFCPKCGTKVKLGYYKKIINSKSPEVKTIVFSNVNALFGDVKFIIRCFYCPNCQINISFDDMQIYEKKMKRKNKENKKK